MDRTPGVQVRPHGHRQPDLIFNTGIEIREFAAHTLLADDVAVAAAEAEEYHARQIGWLADTDVDMVTALTFTQSDEAIGVVRAADAARLPIVVSFTVETDGSLPTGESLGHAIEAVDAATNGSAAYLMVNCAHPDHFRDVIVDAEWAHRICGVRCNASRMSHAELDEAETLDDGDIIELAAGYGGPVDSMPCHRDRPHAGHLTQSALSVSTDLSGAPPLRCHSGRSTGSVHSGQA